MKEEKEMSEVRVTSREAAVEIEQAMADEYGDPGNENYRSKFRTLQHNLKDHKNGTLRKRYGVTIGWDSFDWSKDFDEGSFRKRAN